MGLNKREVTDSDRWSNTPTDHVQNVVRTCRQTLPQILFTSANGQKIYIDIYIPHLQI